MTTQIDPTSGPHRALTKMRVLFFSSQVLALVVCGLGVWIRCEWDFKMYVHELQMYQFWTGAFILIAASVIVMLLSAFGCYGAITENPTVLLLVGLISNHSNTSYHDWRLRKAVLAHGERDHSTMSISYLGESLEAEKTTSAPSFTMCPYLDLIDIDSTKQTKHSLHWTLN